MTTLSWDLVGGDPAPGDPGAFDQLAGSLGETADHAAEAHSRLSRLSAGVDSSIWRGKAADEFREKIQDLPPKLEKLHQSYEAASRALAEYGRVLAELQPRARRLLEEAVDADQDEAAQQQRRDQAEANQSADPLSPGAASATAPFDQAIDDARGRREDARSGIEDIREERESAEGRAIAGLGRAGDLGIENKSWFQHALSAVDAWVDEHADFLRAVSGVLKIVSAVAGVLSFIPVLAPICGPIALAAGGAALLLDATLCATGNGDWKALAVDAALMVLPGAGRLASMGLRTARAGGAARVGSTIRPIAPRGKALPVAGRNTRGDPVDVATGEMVLSQVDVELPGTLSLVLARTHVSSYREGRWFGPSWASTLDQRLEVDGAGVCYAAADGMVLVYPTPSVGGGEVLPVEGPRWPLASTDNGGYTVTDPDRGHTLYFARGRPAASCCPCRR